MSFSYFDPNEDKGQKYARLYPKQPIDTDLSCEITFKELVIQTDDTFMTLTGEIESHSRGIESSFKEFNAKGKIVQIKLLNKAEHTTSYKGVEKTRKQSTLEMFLCDRLTKLDLEKAYSGTIRFRFDGMLNYLLAGSITDENMRQTEELSAIDLTPLETKTIEPEPLNAGSNYGGGKFGKSYSQTEKQKLEDRLAFYLEQMKIMFPETPLETIADLNGLIAENDDFTNSCLQLITDIANLRLKADYIHGLSDKKSKPSNQKPGL